MRVPKSSNIVRLAIAGAIGFAVVGFGISEASAPSDSVSTTTTTTPQTTTTESRPTTTTSAPAPSSTTTTISPEALAEALEEELMVLNSTYAMGERSSAVESLQKLLGITADGFYWNETRAAHVAELKRRGLSTTNVPAAVSSGKYSRSCPEWEPLALSVGWPAEQIPKLSYVIARESNCHPTSWNQADPGTGSRGLTQINSFWCTKNQYNPDGFLQARGILSTCDDLFDPATSLRASLVIWNRSGWSPWGG